MRFLGADLRYALRMLRKAPGFTLVVVLTLGLGTGAATAMFSVVNGLLLRPLPYPDAERLVTLWQGRRGQDVEEDWFSVAQFVDIRDQTSVFEEVTLAVGFGATLTERGAPIQVGYIRTTSTFLELLGATPAMGRVFDASDNAGDAPTVALISFEMWERAFGGDPNVIGQTVTLDGTPREIVGVLSRDVLLDNEVLPTLGAVNPLGVVLSLPLSEALLGQRNREDYNIIGRLKPGIPLTQAQAQLDLVAARIQELHETDPGSGFFIRALSLMDEVVGNVRRTLWVLLGSVGILLLIACGNVANLLFARGTARAREMSIRAALGAGQPRLVRQLLTEGAVLATLGGALGVAVAAGSVAALRTIGAASLPRIHAISIDVTVLAFSLGLTALTCVVFALLPALRSARVDVASAMKDGARGVSSGDALWATLNVSNLLVVAQIGLSLVLLIGGGLLGRSLIALRDVDPGFESESHLTFRVRLAGPNYPSENRYPFQRDLRANLAALPGVLGVGMVSHIPFGGNLAWTPATVPGYEPSDGTNGEFIASVRIASPDYFATVGIPLLDGELFEEEYEPEAPRAVLIDQQLAERYFPGRNPIGKPINLLGGENIVVGVVGSIKHTGLEDDSRLTVYFSHSQVATGGLEMVMRTRGDPAEVAEAATRAVHALDPQLAVVDLKTLGDRVASSLAQRRFSMFLLQTFSVVALILAAIGIYGFLSYRVSRSVRGLGMRMALGAQPGTILTLVLTQGLRLAGVGVVVGLMGAVVATQLMQSMLFDVTATDLPTYLAMGGGLTVVSVVACLVPARQATRVDPLEALRAE